ncbi:MAG: hypothetical protein ACPGYT_09015 [Nitrospirales bacterium]
MSDQEISASSTPHEAPTPKKRINTQIHRRSKAKAVYPLSDEWEDTSLPPKQLRMPSTNMGKTGSGQPKESEES